MLRSKGHDVTVKNIFEEEWTAEKLTPFFHNLSFDKWHNPYAPRIKSGDIDPATLTQENIFAEMINDNYLIRRPLLKTEDRYDCGFDSVLARELMEDSDVTEVLVCHQADNVCE
jgi:nitrogenase-associated protein